MIVVLLFHHHSLVLGSVFRAGGTTTACDIVDQFDNHTWKTYYYQVRQSEVEVDAAVAVVAAAAFANEVAFCLKNLADSSFLHRDLALNCFCSYQPAIVSSLWKRNNLLLFLEINSEEAAATSFEKLKLGFIFNSFCLCQSSGRNVRRHQER